MTDELSQAGTLVHEGDKADWHGDVVVGCCWGEQKTVNFLRAVREKKPLSELKGHLS